MIKIENVSKAFSDKVVLSKISFTANEGEVTALIGPNGSGKSTLIKILLGLISTDEGKATFDGKNYEELGKYPFRYVGAFLDSFQPNPTRIDKQRCLECLKIVGLQDVGNKRIKDYSLGMKQRLGLATAILANPRILILDEPINGLDPDGIRWVREFLREFVRNGKIVLITSHYMNELELTVDKIVGLSNGKVVIDGSSKDVLEEYGSFEEAYFKSVTS